MTCFYIYWIIVMMHIITQEKLKLFHQIHFGFIYFGNILPNLHICEDTHYYDNAITVVAEILSNGVSHKCHLGPIYLSQSIMTTFCEPKTLGLRNASSTYISQNVCFNCSIVLNFCKKARRYHWRALCEIWKRLGNWVIGCRPVRFRSI